MGKELKPGYYCQWCYQQLVDSAISQNKGVTPGESEDSGLNELCGCGKKAVVEAKEFYDIERVKKMFCAYDKDRVCDETCAAFTKDTYGIESEPFFDESDPFPQYKWKSSTVLKGSRCKRGSHMLESEVVKRTVKP